MNIQTGWTNDDFVKNIVTLRIDDPENQLMVQFKAETIKPNMTDSVCMRLVVFKASNRFKMLLKSKATGRIVWGEVL